MRGLCGPNVPTKINDPCSRADGCATGLTCNAEGKCSMAGSEGNGLQGAECDDSSACAFGYSCDINGACSDFPKWSGVDCPPVRADTTPTIEFSIGNGDQRDGDFFALPFPNDVRNQGGYVNYSNFPGLESTSAPGPTVATYAGLLNTIRKGSAQMPPSRRASALL